jgi:RNA polymerase sigma-70 factor (ECF subfamily)
MESEELFRSCAATGDAAAWEEFVSRFHRLIASVVLRTARTWGEPSRNLVDDLVQDTYLKLCENRARLLRDFEPRHPEAIFGFLKVVASNVVKDHFKSAHADKRGAGHTPEPLDTAEAASLSPRGEAAERAVLLAEIERHLQRCAPGPENDHYRTIFWLYYRQGMSASAIAALPWVELTTKGVESAIFRLTRAVREQMTGGIHAPESGSETGEGFRAAESF